MVSRVKRLLLLLWGVTTLTVGLMSVEEINAVLI